MKSVTMTVMKTAAFCLIGLLTTFGFSSTSVALNNSSDSNVRTEASFSSAVETLMANEARFREQALQLRMAKEATVVRRSTNQFAMNCGPDHDHDDDHKSCVPHCTFRSSNGSCVTYGSDFCAPNAACAQNCTFRGSNGACVTYGEDYCGSGASCSPNCTFRSSSGDCVTYGPDTCY